MKLNILNEVKSSTDLQQAIGQSRKHTRMAPKSREMAVVGGQKQMGHKDRININVDLAKDDIDFVTHTHPIEGGPGTVLGAMPSSQDIMSMLNLAMRSGQDTINTLTNIFINDPSDIEGMIIWHGPWYTVTIPGDKVNLSMLRRYEETVKRGEFDDAVSLIERMGFHFQYGHQE